MISLEAEERCGHLITEDYKKLWNVQMGCLEELKRICAKHNIKYFAGGGTLLGAVRHKGYIPWDDDIDVFMLKDDYNRFCQIAKDELNPPYFFQHYMTQERAHFGISRIRNSETTACTATEYRRITETENYNCGIFLDVFPLHYALDNTRKIKWQSFWLKFYDSALRGRIYNKLLKRQNKSSWGTEFFKSVFLWRCLSLFFTDEQLKQKRYNVIDKYSTGDKVGLIAFTGHNEKYIWPKEYFSESVELPFEDTTISCPKEYDKILRHQFGDYMIFEKGTSLHSFLILDPDVPYEQKIKEYAAEHAEGEESTK